MFPSTSGRKASRNRLLGAFVAVCACSFALVARAQTAKDLLNEPIRDSPPQDKIAVVIGINDYQKARGLPACGSDAVAFTRFLREKLDFPATSIALLTGDSTDHASIERALNSLTAKVGDNSEVIVFFSGHGLALGGVDFLAPSDADPENVEATCVSFDRLRARLEAKRLRRCLLITDVRSGLQPPSEFSEGFGTFNLPAAPSFVELRSCRPDETAQVMPDGSMGVFTHFLIQGLNGDAGEPSNSAKIVTFDSLERFVATNTARVAEAEFGAKQHPIGHAGYGATKLAVYWPTHPVLKPTPVPPKPPSVADARYLPDTEIPEGLADMLGKKGAELFKSPHVPPPPVDMEVPDKARVVLHTSVGDVTLELNGRAAPLNVKSFLYLAKLKYFDGTKFHRRADLMLNGQGTIVQGGDPLTKIPAARQYAGLGGPGYRIPFETNSLKHDSLVVAAARSQDKNSGGSQFYITLAPVHFLDGSYVVFGRVVEGRAVVRNIQVDTVIKTVEVLP